MKSNKLFVASFIALALTSAAASADDKVPAAAPSTKISADSSAGTTAPAPAKDVKKAKKKKLHDHSGDKGAGPGRDAPTGEAKESVQSMHDHSKMH